MAVLLGVLVHFLGRRHWGNMGLGIFLLFCGGFVCFFWVFCLFVLKLVCSLMKTTWSVKVGTYGQMGLLLCSHGESK